MSLEVESKGLTFLEKLYLVVDKGELDFWEDRRNPPNLSVDEFSRIVDRVELRKSNKGNYGRTGEDYCFKFEAEIKFGGIFEIDTRQYFIKGYFFEKNNLMGVTIQSFREI